MEFVDLIKSKITLSSVVSKKTKLVRKGPYLSGLCPFHSEKTPSFTVNDEQGIFHCFGCGAHGDVIQFLTDTEGLSFKEALESLARMAGLVIPKKQDCSEHEEIIRALNLSANWFVKQLINNPVALKYLKDRNISDKIINKFKIGYAPSRGLQTYLTTQNVNLNTMKKAGLISQNYENNRLVYDYFRNRIVFPIYNTGNTVIAFGGRVITEENQQPKYLNSPESIVFKKRENFYALNNAIKLIRKKDIVIVVEGYLDVLALNQLGIENVVALCGTSATAEHLQKLWNVSREIIICMDGDNAGKAASFKIAKAALTIMKPGYNIKFAHLPANKDPYDLCQVLPLDKVYNIFYESSMLSVFLWEHELKQVKITDPLLSRPESYSFLYKNLMEYVKCISDSSMAMYYKNFFKDNINDLHYDNRKRRFNNKKNKNLGGYWTHKIAHITTKAIEKEAYQLGIMRVVLDFPELLDNPEYFDYFSEFCIEAADICLLQKNIIDLKIKYPELLKDFLHLELRKLNLGETIDYIFKKTMEDNVSSYQMAERVYRSIILSTVIHSINLSINQLVSYDLRTDITQFSDIEERKRLLEEREKLEQEKKDLWIQ